MANIKLSPALGLVVQCGIGLIAFSWIIARGDLDLAQVTQRLSQVALLPLAIGILCFGMSIGLGALRYKLFFSPVISISYLLGVTLFQNTLLTFMPWRLGEVSYPMLLHRDYNIPLSKSTAVLLSIRLVDLLIILTVVITGGRQLKLDMGWIWVLFGIVSFFGVLIVFILQRGGGRVSALISKLISAIEPLRQPLCFLHFVVLSVSIFLFTTLQSMFILQAVALSVNPVNMALFNAVTQLTALLPIHPPGGWGTMDSIQIILLEGLGYCPNESTPSILAAHSFYALLIFLGGIIGWVLRGKGRPAGPEAGP